MVDINNLNALSAPCLPHLSFIIGHSTNHQAVSICK